MTDANWETARKEAKVAAEKAAKALNVNLSTSPLLNALELELEQIQVPDDLPNDAADVRTARDAIRTALSRRMKDVKSAVEELRAVLKPPPKTVEEAAEQAKEAARVAIQAAEEAQQALLALQSLGGQVETQEAKQAAEDAQGFAQKVSEAVQHILGSLKAKR